MSGLDPRLLPLFTGAAQQVSSALSGAYDSIQAERDKRQQAALRQAQFAELQRNHMATLQARLAELGQRRTDSEQRQTNFNAEMDFKGSEAKRKQGNADKRATETEREHKANEAAKILDAARANGVDIPPEAMMDPAAAAEFAHQHATAIRQAIINRAVAPGVARVNQRDKLERQQLADQAGNFNTSPPPGLPSPGDEGYGVLAVPNAPFQPRPDALPLAPRDQIALERLRTKQQATAKGGKQPQAPKPNLRTIEALRRAKNTAATQAYISTFSGPDRVVVSGLLQPPPQDD